jgi:predicted GNAT superfamily acetyltransferase
VSDDYTIRPFETIEEYRECVDLQEDTWGHGFSERVAPAILKVAQILGGVSAGAYDADGGLAGFVFGMTGLRDGELVHWSDMLAVRPEARDSGLGRRLKAYQRDQVMARGVAKMFWTFDPLQARNAHLNFNRLGIVVREYVEDMYGQTDSHLHRGIGTDRFIALWLLASERVRDLMADGASGLPAAVERKGEPGQERGGERDGEPTQVGTGEGVREPGNRKAPAVALAGRLAAGHPRPTTPDLSRTDERIAVRIPSDLGALMEDDPELALAWRAATREAFRHYLADGYEVRAFARGERLSTYLLSSLEAGPPATPTES